MKQKVKLDLEGLKVESLEMPQALELRDPSSPKSCLVSCGPGISLCC